MIEAGIKAFLENKSNTPDALVSLVWEAMAGEKQKEALEKYWLSGKDNPQPSLHVHSVEQKDTSPSYRF